MLLDHNIVILLVCHLLNKRWTKLIWRHWSFFVRISSEVVLFIFFLLEIPFYFQFHWIVLHILIYSSSSFTLIGFEIHWHFHNCRSCSQTFTRCRYNRSGEKWSLDKWCMVLLWILVYVEIICCLTTAWL